jgi:hypothetical protein
VCVYIYIYITHLWHPLVCLSTKFPLLLHWASFASILSLLCLIIRSLLILVRTSGPSPVGASAGSGGGGGGGGGVAAVDKESLAWVSVQLDVMLAR